MTTAGDGLRIARFLMVLSGLSPLFVLWAVRGIPGVSDLVLAPVCAVLVGAPALVLALRIRTARKQGDRRVIVVGATKDHGEHLLVYLAAVLMPLYDVNLGEPRQVWAMIIALSFVVFLFWHLGLHYINVAFALAGYRVFSVWSEPSRSPAVGQVPYALLTKRSQLRTGESISALRISNTVYFEWGDE